MTIEYDPQTGEFYFVGGGDEDLSVSEEAELWCYEQMENDDA